MQRFPSLTSGSDETIRRWALKQEFLCSFWGGDGKCEVGASGRQWNRFFLSGWNLFDTVVVVLCFMPAVGQLSAVARLARILRALRKEGDEVRETLQHVEAQVARLRLLLDSREKPVTPKAGKPTRALEPEAACVEEPRR